jgi:hypothetical protein
LYYFIDVAGERKLIGSGNIRWTGAWSGSTSYILRDSATDGLGHNWLALAANQNVALPSTFTSVVPTTWTHLVAAETSSLSPEDQAIATANAAGALSTAALTAAWAGTGVANAAMAVAVTGLETSWVGTGVANAASANANYAIYQTGTLDALLSLRYSGSHSFWVSSTGVSLDTVVFVSGGIIIDAAPPLA